MTMDINNRFPNFDLKDRAEIAWSNTWVEHAPDLSRKRFLIIGDSVPRDYRGSLAKFLPGYSVDFIGSSSIFEDTLLYDLCDMVFKENIYHWSFVILALGGNHGLNLQTHNNQEDSTRYKKSLNVFIDYLQQRFNDVLIINTAPNRLSQNLKKYDENVNREISSRNLIMQQIASERGLKDYIDLYDYVMQNGFKFKDPRHFKDKKTQEKIACFIINRLCKCGLLKNEDMSVKPQKTLLQKLLKIFTGK